MQRSTRRVRRTVLQKLGAQKEFRDAGTLPAPGMLGPGATSWSQATRSLGQQCPGVPSSGQVLHGDSKARRKCHFRQQIPESWAQGAEGQVWRELGLE